MRDEAREFAKSHINLPAGGGMVSGKGRKGNIYGIYSPTLYIGWRL